MCAIGGVVFRTTRVARRIASRERLFGRDRGEAPIPPTLVTSLATALGGSAGPLVDRRSGVVRPVPMPVAGRLQAVLHAAEDVLVAPAKGLTTTFICGSLPTI